MNKLARKFGKAWSMRRRLGNLRSWLYYVYGWLLWRLPRAPLPGRGRAVSVRLRDHPRPLWLRLGTSDWAVLEEVYFDGEYQPLIDRNIGTVRTILDLGANCGLTVQLWRRHFPGARILAVEPDAANMEVCRRNAAVFNGGGLSGDVAFAQACVAAKPGMVSLERSAGAWAFRMRPDAVPGTDAVRAMTVPELLDAAQMSSVDVLKCDVEGAEEQLFADCGAWIGKVRHMVVEIHPPYTGERFADDLRRSGARFDVYHRVTGSSPEVWFLTQTFPATPAEAATHR